MTLQLSTSSFEPGAGLDALKSLLSTPAACVGIVGLGYVGLPLASAAHNADFRVIGFDIDQHRVDQLKAGKSPIKTWPDAHLEKMNADGRFLATSDASDLVAADVIMICVPTPLGHHRDPDLSYVVRTAEMLRTILRPGQLIVLESTTYPGTTDEVLKPVLEQSGLKAGVDFFLAYSPEREDPGNLDFETATIPRVIGADDDASRDLAQIAYGRIIKKIVTVSSTRTAEAVKLTENIFRAVNIALVNELKQTYAKMGINVWEVIDAAASKPFGFMPFYPGPGLGGHCIPIDPFYLTWKAREYDVPTRFIELAGDVNAEAPRQVVAGLSDALSRKLSKSLNGARVLLLGLAYKKDVDDMRESPSLRIFEALEEAGAVVDYFDPHIPVVPPTREHPSLTGRESFVWTEQGLTAYDVALICTDHSDVDYQALVQQMPLVVDSRNATRSVADGRDRIVMV